jgi:hypothetical protein
MLNQPAQNHAHEGRLRRQQRAAQVALKGHRESISSMGNLKEMAHIARKGPLPRFPTLRYIPLRYRRWLSLQLARRYQCLVIGAAQDVLTVAVSSPHEDSFYIFLEQLTGHTIFPVLVEPATLRLLLKRLEQQQLFRGYWSRPSCYIHPDQMRALMPLLTIVH